MSYTLHNIEQNSPEWEEIRLGRFTASQAYRLCGAKGLGVSGENYAEEVATEQVTGMPAKEMFSNIYTEHGHEFEPEAALHYEAYCNIAKRFTKPITLKQHGFAIADWSEDVGVSIDRFIPEFGFIAEIKCGKNNVTHTKHRRVKDTDQLKELKTGSTKSMYYWQIIHQMLAYNADHADFISYNPNFADLRLHVVGVPRRLVENDIQFLKGRLEQAIELKNKIIEQIKS